jgi:hypothetical protein
MTNVRRLFDGHRPGRYCVLAVAVLLSACGGGTVVSPTPTSPSVVPTPTPAAASITVAGTLTDTVTGAPIGTYSESVARLPARLTLSAPGHYSRTTTVRTQGQAIDLIPESGFDLEFYRQFARESLGDGDPLPLRVLTRDVAFYVQIEGASGLPAQVAAQLEPVARRLIPQLTGGRIRVSSWDTGTATRAPQAGVIIVERSDEESNVCGSALIGELAGHIWIDSNRACNVTATFAHEIGHALGFSHVTRPGSLMFSEQPFSNLNDAPTEIELRHALIAYSRPRGNRDIDVDP